MEQRGDLLVFPYPGGEISFHKDLKVYFDVCNMIWSGTSDILTDINNQDPQKGLDQLTQKLINFVRKTILPSLYERKIYNVVEDDFIMGNPAYIEMVSSTQNYQKNKSDAIAQSAYTIQEKKDLAYNKSQSMITGLDYDIISNSLVTHAMYASKNIEAAKKQAWEAQKYYNEAAHEIESSGKRELANVLGAAKRAHNSNMEKMFPVLLGHMTCVYCEKLEAAGQYNSSCLVGIEEARSNAVLENLKIAEFEKAEIVYSAIQLCPYNINAFRAAYDTMDITAVPCSKEILDCFKMIESLCVWLKSNRQKTSTSARTFYVQSRKLIKTISYLKEVPEETIAQKLLSDKLESDLAGYTRFSKKIKTNVSLEKTIEEICDASAKNDPQKYSTFLENWLIGQHLSEEDIAFYKKEGLDVFGALSESYGQKITSFSDADALIEAAWRSEAKAIADSQKRLELEIERNKLQGKLKEDRKDFSNYIKTLAILIIFTALGFMLLTCRDDGLKVSGFAMIFLCGLPAAVSLYEAIAFLIGIKENEKRIDELNELLKN